MATVDDQETGFSQSDIDFARETFYRDCPNGFCSKRKFLTFMRTTTINSTLSKANRSSLIEMWLFRQNYRQTKKFFSMMFDIYDRNGDGKLDFEEYLYALSALTGVNRLRTVETLYNFFDLNNQGFITRQEFNSRKKLAAQFLGQSKTGIQDNLSYDRAFNTMDTDGDDRISKDEFIQWHLEDHQNDDSIKPMKRRTRLLKNISNLVDLRGQIKTSSLQQKDHLTRNPLEFSPMSIHADRYLLKVLRRARNRFIHHRDIRSNLSTNDNQSDSGIFTPSIRTNPTEDFESNSLLDIEEDDDFSSFHPDDSDNELLCESLEAVLMETLMELRQYRQTRDLVTKF